MFSPEASIQGSTVLRNPRRRQRTILDESLAALPSTKRRKRSSLAPDSFEGPLTRQTNDHHGSVDGNANGLVTSTRKASVAGLDITSLTITGQSSKKGKKEKRGDQVLLVHKLCLLSIPCSFSCRPRLTTTPSLTITRFPLRFKT